MFDIIKKVSVQVLGGPGGAGFFCLNSRAKESYGTTGGLFVNRKSPYKPSKPQRIVTCNLNINSTATAVTLDGTDDGDTQVAANAAAVTYTLPKASVVGPGYTVIVMTGTVPASVGTTVTPNAADKFAGNGFNAKTAGQTLVNTQASAAVGDQVDLISDGVSRWFVLNKVGTWA